MRKNSLSCSAFGLSLAFVLVANHARAADLVLNGGFESGFNNWNVVPQAPFTANIISSPAEDIHSGAQAAQFASFGTPFNTVSQFLNTTAGQTYNISFWMQAGDGGGGNFPANSQEFRALFNGTTMLDESVTTGHIYTQYTYQETATSNSTLLEFDSENDFSWNYLDDVSVTPVPEPATAFLAITGLIGLGGVALARYRAA